MLLLQNLPWVYVISAFSVYKNNLYHHPKITHQLFIVDFLSPMRELLCSVLDILRTFKENFFCEAFFFSFKSKPSFLMFENTSSMSLSRGQLFWLCISLSLESLMITRTSLSSPALDLQDDIFEVWPRRKSVGRYESSIIFIIWVDTIRWGIEILLSDLSKSHRWTVSSKAGAWLNHHLPV